MDWRIIEGDCRDVLAALPERSAHSCVTSPPYFGLRDYGHDGQIGLEPTPDEFVAALVDVFREVRRVLRDDGTVWLNLGDSFAGGAGGRGDRDSAITRADGSTGKPSQKHDGKRIQRGMGDAKPKDLLGIPWMVAFALRADGWYLRSDIIWSKPNPMPESVTDRPTKAHEYLFLLSKGARYFYDADAIREDNEHPDRTGTNPRLAVSTQPGNTFQGRDGRTIDSNPDGRNKRSVWTVATQPYAGAHFATFPPKLIEPCILAGAPERACGECGAPWVRVVEREPGQPHTRGEQAWTNGSGTLQRDNPGGGVANLSGASRTVGFEPSCSHGDGSASGVVLDPFAGSGTTGMVALRHGRSFVGVELKPAYAAMARWRIRDDAPLLNGASELAA